MTQEGIEGQYSCYYPDKSMDLKGFACNGTAIKEGGASACCLPNDICFSNGACYQDWSDVMYRLSCTDPTFRDPACAPWCLQDGSYVPTSTLLWLPTHSFPDHPKMDRDV